MIVKAIYFLVFVIVMACDNKPKSNESFSNDSIVENSNSPDSETVGAIRAKTVHQKSIPENFKSIKWHKKIADSCQSVLSFENNNLYTFHNCEMENTEYGTFLVHNDTLILTRIGAYEDSLYDKNSPHRVGKARYKLVYTNDGFRYISLENWFKEQWKPSNFPIEDSPPIRPFSN